MIKTRDELIKDLASEAVNLIVEGRKEEAEELMAKIRKHKEAQGITLTHVGDPECEACQ